MGFRFGLMLLYLFSLGGKHFQSFPVFLRFAKRRQQSQRQPDIRHGGDGKAGSADGEAHFLFGGFQADALLVGSGGEGFRPTPCMVGSVGGYQNQVRLSRPGDRAYRLLAQFFFFFLAGN